MEKFTVRTTAHAQFVNIDREINRIIDHSGALEGVCRVFVPHTTAGITINENADPDVVRDILASLDRLVPWNDNYAHTEGNSAAHIKASIMGFSQAVFIQNGAMALGTWQSVFFCEFDGPRNRQVWIEITAAG
ncbi:MAG TPA: secondary thiamine-phosphate synthase enzyme YjbQ [Candidatus Bathyarchaeia archaeon]|nr:secondary thiamine-phosphate synthase enzyme YjbQ [Candidatus Bathyarchaeia archaeon]